MSTEDIQTVKSRVYIYSTTLQTERDRPNCITGGPNRYNSVNCLIVYWKRQRRGGHETYDRERVGKVIKRETNSLGRDDIPLVGVRVITPSFRDDPCSVTGVVGREGCVSGRCSLGTSRDGLTREGRRKDREQDFTNETRRRSKSQDQVSESCPRK